MSPNPQDDAENGENRPKGVTSIRRRPLLGTVAAAGSLSLVSSSGSARSDDDDEESSANGGDSGNGGRSAASIRYRKTPRPDEVPSDFDAPDDTTLDFYRIRPIDDPPVGGQAALLEPDGTDRSTSTLVVVVHGSGGDFYSSREGAVTQGLPERGYPVLGINTRQTGDAVNTDNFLDVRKDIEAAVATAEDLGYRRIALSGGSLGNIHVQFYAATDWNSAVKGVMLLAPFANLPWKSRVILIQDEENYRELYAEAIEHLAEGTLDEEMDTQMGWLRGSTEPVTARHFLTYRWEETSTAAGTYWIKRIPRPILMVRDENDRVVRDFEPYDLLARATSEGTLVPDIEYTLLPNDTDRGGHSFQDNQEALVDTMAGWLSDQGL